MVTFSDFSNLCWICIKRKLMFMWNSDGIKDDVMNLTKQWRKKKKKKTLLQKHSTLLTSLPVNLQGDKTGMASPSYSKDTPLKWDLAKPTSSSWLTPEEEARQINHHPISSWTSRSSHLPECLFTVCVRKERTYLQLQTAPCEGLCSGCWCSPLGPGGSRSWENCIWVLMVTYKMVKNLL